MSCNFSKYALATMLATIVSSAQAEVVVVVSAKTSVGEMDKQQVADLFLGKVNTFPDGRQAVPLEQAEGGAAEEFHTKVINKTEHQLRAYWAKKTFSGTGTPPKELPGSNDVKKLVAENPNMIGYIEKGMVDGSVKVIFAH